MAMAVKKESALQFASVLTCVATALSIWSGVFDKGATSGTLNEKIVNIQSTIDKMQSSIGDLSKSGSDSDKRIQDLKIDVIRLQEQLISIRQKIQELDDTARRTR